MTQVRVEVVEMALAMAAVAAEEGMGEVATVVAMEVVGMVAAKVEEAMAVVDKEEEMEEVMAAVMAQQDLEIEVAEATAPVDKAKAEVWAVTPVGLGS